MRQVIVSMLGSVPKGGILTILTVVWWIVSASACMIVLVAKSTKLVKIILMIVGCYIIYSTIVGLMKFDLLGTAINLFIGWWTYNLFQSVKALDIVTR